MIGGKKKPLKQPKKGDKMLDEVKIIAMSIDILYYYRDYYTIYYNQLGRHGIQGETKRREEKTS